ncbi:MAG: 3'(2'),5'-bisphosphate nucleotidase [Gammaproteobacteria bacterium]|nr:3'(2'),5'-bisphosphate nucleotidase [Gammaproteobacteria bacterium]
MSMSSLELATARHAVADACAVTRTVQQRLGALQALTKDDRSPVTVADYAAQAVIGLRLGAAFGSFAMIGEESAAALRAQAGGELARAVADAVRTVCPGVSDAAVLDAIDCGDHDPAQATAIRRYWTLDPVDGTKGFLRGGQYAVSLALIEDGTVTLGVLGCPNLGADETRAFDDPDPVGTLFHAQRGGGAWCGPANDPAAPATRIAIGTGRVLRDMRVCESVESGHSRHDFTSRIVAHLEARGMPARLDSQAKYAVVARGQADAYLRLPTSYGYVEKIWDHAAGKIVAEEAGAIVTDIEGKPLDFAHGATLTQNRGVVCATPAFHAAIIAAIDALMP